MMNRPTWCRDIFDIYNTKVYHTYAVKVKLGSAKTVFNFHLSNSVYNMGFPDCRLSPKFRL